MKLERLPVLILAVCCLGPALSACGQRGPLYLPDDTAETVVPASDEENEPDESEDA